MLQTRTSLGVSGIPLDVERFRLNLGPPHSTTDEEAGSWELVLGGGGVFPGERVRVPGLPSGALALLHTNCDQRRVPFPFWTSVYLTAKWSWALD